MIKNMSEKKNLKKTGLSSDNLINLGMLTANMDKISAITMAITLMWLHGSVYARVEKRAKSEKYESHLRARKRIYLLDRSTIITI